LKIFESAHDFRIEWNRTSQFESNLKAFQVATKLVETLHKAGVTGMPIFSPKGPRSEGGPHNTSALGRRCFQLQITDPNVLPNILWVKFSCH